MMNSFLSKSFALLVMFLCISTLTSYGQKKLSWKKQAKMAANFEKSGDFYQAALFYEGAYNAKPSKQDNIYKAGNCYFKLRDYANAVKCLESVKTENTKYDKPGYKYALALKQNGEPAKAVDAFKAFQSYLNGSKEKNKDQLSKEIDTQIKGCAFAQKAEELANQGISIQHLDGKINTDKTEFAPIPFGSNGLYYSTTSSGVAQIYGTKKQGTSWARPKMHPVFEKVTLDRPHFCNGTLTEDGTRFYFTECDVVEGKPECTIYVITKSEDNKWSDPEKLPEYINIENTNSTHPFVTTIDDKEIIYYASDREGGKGGLDIWYFTRTAGSRGNNYTIPKNLGVNINTANDEITPFYDKENEALYFSSNGRVSAGGYDIFKSKGAKLQWEVAQNLGFPINSPADDNFYVLSAQHGGGYFVSNRKLMPNKLSTSHDDIFFFGDEQIVIAISGNVLAKGKSELGNLTDVTVKVFADDELVNEKKFATGDYSFKLAPYKLYTIEISREGYTNASFEVNTKNAKHSDAIEKDIEMMLPQDANAPLADVEPVVPLEYNSTDNPYTLPDTPIDVFGEELTGTRLEEYIQIKEGAAAASPTGQVYYDGEELLPYFPPSEPIETETVADNTTSEPDETTEPTDNNDSFEATDNETETPVETETEAPAKVEEIYPVESAPEGITYKIQVAAVKRYKSHRFENLKEIGKLNFEYVGKLRRVMVIPQGATTTDGFDSKGAALNHLSFVINNSPFKNAFVIKYVDGVRTGDGFRGWDEEETSTTTKPSTPAVKEEYNGF